MGSSKGDNIILVGPMGVGKTTVGRLVSGLLGREFIDTDFLIEEMTGLSIARIFSERSEAYFRSLEREVVENIKGMTNLVIAAGGGMIIPEDNYRVLHASGVLICLMASVDVIAERLKESNGRPLLHNGDKREVIKSHLESRMKAYDKIEHCIDTDSLQPESIAQNIVRIFRSRIADV